jgi:hypothetical protein
MKYGLVAPDAAYYALVAAGLAAAFGIIASTLPLLRRITGPEAVRNGLTASRRTSENGRSTHL